MQLPPEQTARFYRIWLALLHNVNDQLHLVPAFPTSEERNGLLALSDELHLRNALWADDELREHFISANPADLSSADLAVVANWRYRRAGSFYIVRALKNIPSFFLKTHPHGPTACSACPPPLRNWHGVLSPSSRRRCSCPLRARSSTMGCCSGMRSYLAVASARGLTRSIAMRRSARESSRWLSHLPFLRAP